MINKTITGLILAGGKSSRMGTDKGFVMYNNKPFTQHIIDALQPLANEVIIVSDTTDYDIFNVKRVEDTIKNAGPLAGLYSGLYHSKTEINIVLSCDVPLVNQQLLKQLLNANNENVDVIQCKVGDKTMPLIALYKKRIMNDCMKTLESGEGRLRVFVDKLQSKTIVLDHCLERYSVNINTPNELKQLKNETKH